MSRKDFYMVFNGLEKAYELWQGAKRRTMASNGKKRYWQELAPKSNQNQGYELARTRIWLDEKVRSVYVQELPEVRKIYADVIYDWNSFKTGDNYLWCPLIRRKKLVRV